MIRWSQPRDWQLSARAGETAARRAPSLSPPPRPSLALASSAPCPPAAGQFARAKLYRQSRNLQWPTIDRPPIETRITHWRLFYTVSIRSHPSARPVFWCCECSSCMAALAFFFLSTLSVYLCPSCQCSPVIAIGRLVVSSVSVSHIERRCPGVVSRSVKVEPIFFQYDSRDRSLS